MKGAKTIKGLLVAQLKPERFLFADACNQSAFVDAKIKIGAAAIRQNGELRFGLQRFAIVFALISHPEPVIVPYELINIKLK